LCPFHKERSPSFSVSPAKQIFKCFGCGAGGDVFSFIERMERVEFLAARAIVAEIAGVSILNREWNEAERRKYAKRMAMREDSRNFWRNMRARFVALAGAIYSLEQRASRVALAHSDDAAFDSTPEAEVCWLAFRLVAFGNQLTEVANLIRDADSENLDHVFR